MRVAQAQRVLASGSYIVKIIPHKLNMPQTGTVNICKAGVDAFDPVDGAVDRAEGIAIDR